MKAKRVPYQQSEDKHPVLQHMCNIAYDPSTARKILNRLDKLHSDDDAEAAAKAKRERKAAKVAALVAKQKL